MSWVNGDGLERKFGTESAERALIGEFRNDGPAHITEIAFTYADLPAVASNSVLIDDDFTLPAGAFIESVEIWCPVDMDCTSDDRTLNVGRVDTGRRRGADVLATRTLMRSSWLLRKQN